MGSRWSNAFGTFASGWRWEFLVTGLLASLAIGFGLGFGMALSSDIAIRVSDQTGFSGSLIRTATINLTVSAPGVGTVGISIFFSHLTFKICNVLDLLMRLPSFFLFLRFHGSVVLRNLCFGPPFPFSCNFYCPRMLIFIFRARATGVGRSVHSRFMKCAWLEVWSDLSCDVTVLALLAAAKIFRRITNIPWEWMRRFS